MNTNVLNIKRFRGTQAWSRGVFFINPRRACAARVTVLGLSVCPSVHVSSRTTGYEAAYERYLQLQSYKKIKYKKVFFPKRLRSRDDAMWLFSLTLDEQAVLEFLSSVSVDLFSMDNKLSKVCPQCNTAIHV